jgi:hypothetical protein
MAKKTITKEHPITAFRKANEARDVVVKSSMKKMQVGGKTTGTPFQGYMKTPGAVASDTVSKTYYGDKTSTTKSGVMDIKAKNPKNQKSLEDAYKKTFGDDIKDRYTNPSAGETNDQYNRRMGTMKKGGTVKSKKK